MSLMQLSDLFSEISFKNERLLSAFRSSSIDVEVGEEILSGQEKIKEDVFSA